jgi:hypothetical protein
MTNPEDGDDRERQAPGPEDHGSAAVTSTWFSHDLPVLATTITLIEEMDHPGIVRVATIATRANLSPADVWKALLRMESEYVTLHKVMADGDPSPQMVSGVTPAARRAVGQWPSPETLADRLIAALRDEPPRDS